MATLAPYLNFRDQAREAMEFYRSVLGGDLELTTFGEFGVGGPDEADGIMHAQLETDDGLVLQGSDVPSFMGFDEGRRITVSLFGHASEAELLRRRFAGLSEGGEVPQPLERAPWGAEFGMFTDRFGIGWMVNIGRAEGQAEG